MNVLHVTLDSAVDWFRQPLVNSFETMGRLGLVVKEHNSLRDVGLRSGLLRLSNSGKEIVQFTDPMRNSEFLAPAIVR